MALFDDAYGSMTDLQRWIKVRDGSLLTLADVPEIIPLRFTFFLEEWDFIIERLRSQLLISPDLLRL